MKFFNALLAAVFFCSGVCAKDGNLLRGFNYVQRGILEIGGCEQPVSVLVKSSQDRHILQMQGDFGRLATLVLDSNGLPEKISGSAFFDTRWVEKFLFRDFRILLGYNPPKAYRIERDLNGDIRSIKADGYEMLLGNYATIKNSRIPQKISIKAKEYKISLHTILRK